MFKSAREFVIKSPAAIVTMVAKIVYGFAVLVRLDDCLVVLVNSEIVAAHVLVSLAQVVVIVAQVSPKLILEELVSEVVGFDSLVMAILSKTKGFRRHYAMVVLVPIAKVGNHLPFFPLNLHRQSLEVRQAKS
mgnify:FL=1